MENRNLVSSKKMTQTLIGNWFVWAVITSVVYSILYNNITSLVNSAVLSAIIAILLQGFMVCVIWKFSTSSSFKKSTIAHDDVPVLMKNLLIFTIIICLVSAVYKFSNVKSILQEKIDSDYQLKLSESLITSIYTEEQIAEYEKQKEEKIKEVEHQLYIYLAIVEIGLTSVYLLALPLEKRNILRNI